MSCQHQPGLISREDILMLIERIVGDDFCQDLDAIAGLHPEELSEREKVCQEKLGALYRIAHSNRKEATCHSVHDIWRTEAKALLRGAKQEEAVCSASTAT